MDELWYDYLQCLIQRGNLERFKKYSQLFEALHNIEFRYIIDRDENRSADGRDLRSCYNCDFIPDHDIMDHWVSVFEVLLALAIRVDNEYIGDPADPHPEEFFMRMIKNLGLDKIYNGRFRRVDMLLKIDGIINTWLDREFYWSGKGSPFPLYHAHFDQREIEIWDQMNEYVNENY